MPLQGEALVFLTLRRKASGKDKDDSDSMKQRLETAAKRLAQCLPQPDKAMEGLNALMAVRDNHVFTNLQQALSPDVTLQVSPCALHIAPTGVVLWVATLVYAMMKHQSDSADQNHNKDIL